jgi:hypothetical protein
MSHGQDGSKNIERVQTPSTSETLKAESASTRSVEALTNGQNESLVRRSSRLPWNPGPSTKSCTPRSDLRKAEINAREYLFDIQMV